MKIKDLLSIRQSARGFSIDERKRTMKEADNQTRDPNNTRVRIVTPRIGSGAAGQFEDSPVDLSEVGRAYYSDSYIRRSVDKIVGLMFKSGWGFSSLNQEALDYVETRFRLMEESSGQSQEELLREAGLNYVLYANSFFVKTRGSDNLGGLEASGYFGGEPISALFSLSPEHTTVSRDEFGNVENYRVSGDSGSEVEFPPEDIGHMTYHKPTGRAYGVPHINNVIDDVLILRQIEENIARLVYRNIFPLQTYTVGITTQGYEATEDEIDEVSAMIQNAPLDSMMVIPERHKIETVSNGNSAVQAYDYLRYFRQRVFTGLGVSESTMGIGDSSNKSTSDNQSSDLIDLVKDFQQNFAAEFQKEIVNEILFEGGFDPTLLKEDRVVFKFTEIEQSAKIARENHEIQKFLSNVQSIDTTLNNIGYEPEEDFSRFYQNLFGNSSMDTESAKGTVDSKDQPENQNGKQLNPNKDTIKDAHVPKKESESDKSLLTELGVMVNLTTDTARSSEKDELSEKWNSLYQVVSEKKASEFSRNELLLLIEKAFEPESFSESFDYLTFSNTLSHMIYESLDLAEKTSCGTDTLFYRYDTVVCSLYRQCLSVEGGKQ